MNNSIIYQELGILQKQEFGINDKTAQHIENSIVSDSHNDMENKNLFCMSDYVSKTRLNYLEHLLDSRVYDKKKLSLKRELESFLLTKRNKTMVSAEPDAIRFFLLMKDGKGKTQVHDLSCCFVGQFGNKVCTCPKRLSSGTVVTLVGQLKSIFVDFWKNKAWFETVFGQYCSQEIYSSY